MDDDNDLDQQLKKSEILRNESEIGKNNAETKHLRLWKSITLKITSYVFGIIIFVILFASFMSDLYQVACVDRDNKQKQIDKLISQRDSLLNLKQSLDKQIKSIKDSSVLFLK